jgi:hypothetical protein
MEIFKGTKGKWEINDEKSNGIIDASIAYNIQSKSSYLDICAVWKDVGSEIEAEANAKLISCAPEMFEALNKFVDAIESEEIIIKENYDNDGFENSGNRLYTEFKQLIKKATE